MASRSDMDGQRQAPPTVDVSAADQADREAVRACLNGDGESFAVLVRRYQPVLTAICANLLGDLDEALDAAQEAFVQAYQHLDTYDPQRRFRGWLTGIAVKRSLDRLRRRRSFLNFFRRAQQELRLHSEPPPPGVQDSGLFQPLLRRLNERERTVVILRINEECSFREIAEIMGGSEATARVHFLNARRKLQRALSRQTRATPGGER